MTSKAFNRQERHGAPETSRPQPPQPPNLVFIEREEDTIYEPSVEDKQKSTIDPPPKGSNELRVTKPTNQRERRRFVEGLPWHISRWFGGISLVGLICELKLSFFFPMGTYESEREVSL